MSLYCLTKSLHWNDKVPSDQLPILIWRKFAWKFEISSLTNSQREDFLARDWTRDLPNASLGLTTEPPRLVIFYLYNPSDRCIYVHPYGIHYMSYFFLKSLCSFRALGNGTKFQLLPLSYCSYHTIQHSSIHTQTLPSTQLHII